MKNKKLKTVYEEAINSQEKNKFSVVPKITPSQLEEKIASLNKGERKVYETLCVMQSKYGTPEISQLYIGTIVGLTRQQVNRIIKRLVDKGLVEKLYRYHQVCLYGVSPLVLGPLRKTLTKYLPALKNILCFTLLMSSPQESFSAFFQQNVTLSRDINNLFININHTPVPQTLKYGNKERLRELLVATTLTLSSRRSEYNPSKYHPTFNEPEFKRSSMSTIKHPDLFGETLSKLGQDLKLTLWGKIKLTPFSDNVLLHAYKELQKEKEPIESPVSWLFSTCLRVTRELKKEPNWNKYNDIAALYNMPKDPLLSESYIPTKGKVERSSTMPKPSAYKPYKPESRPDLPVITEYVKFQRHAASPLGQQNKEWTSTNPFRRRLLDYLEQNPSEIVAFKQQYPDMWTSLIGEEPCNTSYRGLLSPDLFRFE